MLSARPPHQGGHGDVEVQMGTGWEGSHRYSLSASLALRSSHTSKALEVLWVRASHSQLGEWPWAPLISLVLGATGSQDEMQVAWRRNQLISYIDVMGRCTFSIINHSHPKVYCDKFG